ncbi:hypothetical protein D3C85_1652060 [compost metagenome]
MPPYRVEDDIERTQIPQAFQIVGANHTALGAELFAIGQPFGGPDTDPARITECLAQLNGS